MERMQVLSHAEAPQWVARRLGGHPGTRWVGIDGFGAAGKSTLAARIAAVTPDAAVITVDDFARSGLAGWDRTLFTRQVLAPLLAGKPARYQHWNLLEDTSQGWREVPPNGVVIVEGVSATDVRVRVPWNVTLWVDADEPTRRRRIAARDPAALLETWRTAWWPQEQAYGEQQRPWDRVDAVVR